MQHSQVKEEGCQNQEAATEMTKDSYKDPSSQLKEEEAVDQ